MILYGHMLSSASYRVRIALGLKGLQVKSVLLDLRGGEQRLDEYLQINTQGFVPALTLNDGALLTQTVAIIEYLDEIHPEPPL
jgi:maleylpyruvate isomerase